MNLRMFDSSELYTYNLKYKLYYTTGKLSPKGKYSNRQHLFVTSTLPSVKVVP